MRIPIPVVIGVSLLAVVTCWWLRTKDMDFLTPTGVVSPLPEFMTDPTGAPGATGPVREGELPKPAPPARGGNKPGGAVGAGGGGCFLNHTGRWGGAGAGAAGQPKDRWGSRLVTPSTQR